MRLRDSDALPSISHNDVQNCCFYAADMAIVRGHFCLPVLNMSAQAINSELTFWGQWANFLRKELSKVNFQGTKCSLLWCAHSWNINLKFSWKQAEMAEIKYRTGITVCVFIGGRSKSYQPSDLSKTTSLLSWVLHFNNTDNYSQSCGFNTLSFHLNC